MFLYSQMDAPEPVLGGRPCLQYSFVDFTLDLVSGVLRRGVEEIALRPKSFEVLKYLVEHHGQLVGKNALIGAVWPDAAVGDNSLSQCLFDIRRALGDDSQQLIRTVARRGYVFAAPVSTPVLEFPRDAGPSVVDQPRGSKRKIVYAAGVVVAAVAIVAAVFLWPHGAGRQELAYEQITNFTDSAVWPALSPDGRMVAFLSFHPLRLKNFSDLRLDRHLKENDGQFALSLSPNETKNRRPYDALIPPILCARLQRYLRCYRPVLIGGSNHVPDALWVSAVGGQLSAEVMSKRIVKLTRRGGPPVSPHLFRSCAATTIATDAPEAVHVVPAILGHAGPEISDRYYNLASSLEASRRYNAVLSELRRRQDGGDTYR